MNPTKIIVYRGCESYQNRVNGYIDSDVAIINVSKQVNFTPTYRRGGFRVRCYPSPSFILLFDTGRPVRLYSLAPVFHPGFSGL